MNEASHKNRLFNLNKQVRELQDNIPKLRGDDPYHQALHDIIMQGEPKVGGRTAEDSLSLFGVTLNYDLTSSKDNFQTAPTSYNVVAVQTKKMAFRSIWTELLWFLTGDQDILFLKENRNTIWDEWADENGRVGPMYGYQWRNFNGEGVDQIENVITSMIKQPFSRRHIVSAWNPVQIDEMALAPCHAFFQFNCRRGLQKITSSDGLTSGTGEISKDIYVDIAVYQRSADMFLGVPFNLTSYSMLLQLIVAVMNNRQKDVVYKAGTMTYNLGDAHIYENHFSQVECQLNRYARSYKTVPSISTISWYEPENLTLDTNLVRGLVNEISLPHTLSSLPIKADVAV